MQDPEQLVREDLAFHTALRRRDSLGAFAAASRHVTDAETWVRERLDAMRDVEAESVSRPRCRPRPPACLAA